MHRKSNFRVEPLRAKYLGACPGVVYFEKSAIVNTYSSKFFDDLAVAGYWLASVLLNREQLRVLPTLSAPYTFRIEPSFCFSEKERLKTIQAFKNLCRAIQKEDHQYLFGFLFSEEALKVTFNPLPKKLDKLPVKPGAAFFICHPVDLDHLRKILPLSSCFLNEELEQLIERFSKIQKFTPYHQTTLRNSKGAEKQVVFMGVPLTSQSFYNAIRSGNQVSIVSKIQQAIDEAEAAGAATIGLGQFTSIVSQNGSLLSTQKAQLTTGNAYTASLTLQALRSVCKTNGMILSDLNVALVGAEGNMLSVIAESLAGEVCKMTLVQRKLSKRSKKQLERTAILLDRLNQKQVAIPLGGEQLRVLSIPQIIELLEQNKWNEQQADFFRINR